MNNINNLPTMLLSVPALTMIHLLDGESGCFNFNKHMKGESGLTDDFKINVANRVLENGLVLTRPGDKNEIFTLLPNKSSLAKIDIEISEKNEMFDSRRHLPELVGKLMSKDILDVGYLEMVDENYQLVLNMIDKIKGEDLDHLNFDTSNENIVITLNDIVFTIFSHNFYGIEVNVLSVSKPGYEDFFVPFDFFDLLAEGVRELESLTMVAMIAGFEDEQSTEREPLVKDLLSMEQIDLLSHVLTVETHFMLSEV
ncbi:hypothetical protein [Vibrio sp. Vb0587]|uniref:hypothetical protein n=1 Tax=Vibrio sp. Vb0587 TaxID=3074626 RepID=UPI0029640374|nr:hypothetical protein [Vibrio sp. Vb0587]MDW1963958.1 hypothetical protein [Vibrio sp. Vb0587]